MRAVDIVDLEDKLEKRLQKHREANDRQLSENQTANLRGQIEEVKFFLSLLKGDRTKPTVDPVRYSVD